MKPGLWIAAVLVWGIGCTRPEHSTPIAAEYVGIDACATCHPTQAATFIESQMGRSWELATPVNSAADFDTPEPVYDAHNDLHYQALREDSALFVMEYRLSGADTVHKRIEKIDYIVGSGHHTNSHIMDVNGYLYQMPLTWYVQQGRWDLPPGFVGPNNSRFDRPIPLKCITCHNAMPGYVPGSENKYDFVPHGIDCERCHGPGSKHIERVSSGGDIAGTIVNPAKLPLDRQFDICQGCHLQGASVNRANVTFADFRPGQALADIENVFWPRFADSVRQFVMASHPDRLRQSACFQASENLTCITCHDPHVRIEAMGENHYRNVCQDCHTGPELPECPTPEAARGADCTTCHMPVSGSKDIPHVTITDHFIRSPGRDSLVLGSPDDGARLVRMASLLDPAPTPSSVAEGYLTYYETVTNHPGFLDSALVQLSRAQADGEDVTDLLIRTYFLQQDFDEVIRLAPGPEQLDEAWTAYRIGDSFLAAGRPYQAMAYLEVAVRLSPAHLRFMLRLASAYSQNGRQQDAIDLFSRALSANPKLTDAYNDRGFAYVLMGDAERAEADFLEAIALDPDSERALANLASLYFNIGRKEEARPYVRRLLDIDSANWQFRRLWALVR